MILGEPRAMRDVLRRLGAGQAFTRKRLFDVLAAAGECHHLLACVAVKLPSSVMARDSDFVSALPDLAGQLGAVDCRCKALRTVDLDRIEAAPLAVRAASHVGDDRVRVKMRAGAVAVLAVALDPPPNLIEPRAYPLAA